MFTAKSKGNVETYTGVPYACVSPATLIVTKEVHGFIIDFGGPTHWHMVTRREVIAFVSGFFN